LSEVKDRAIDTVGPGDKITIESVFEKSGYIDMLKTILRLLLTGTIYVDDKINVTVQWTWLGERKKQSKDIKIRAYLPVKNVHWHMC
jgi:hypothetical protein